MSPKPLRKRTHPESVNSNIMRPYLGVYERTDLHGLFVPGRRIAPTSAWTRCSE
jgi:hypothetical protein